MKKIIFLFFVLLSNSAFAKIVIVITPERIPTILEQSSTTTTVISEEEIQSSQELTVGEILNNVPGIHVTTQGGLGKQTSVFLRGAKSEHTLVYIDGVEVNDPSSPSRGFDFANLSLDNIERIEVVRGSQGVLYGSDAIGGVIQIFTKKKKSEELETENIFSGGFGSFKTHQEGILSTIRNKKYSATINLSHIGTDGISSSDEDDNPNAEKDPYQLTTIQSSFSVTPTEKSEVTIFERYQTSKNSIDDFGGVGGDDPNFLSDENDFYSGIRASTQYKFYHPELIFGYTLINRKLDDQPNTTDPSTYTAQFLGRTIKPTLLHRFDINSQNNILIGNEYEREDFESTSNFGNSPSVDAYNIASFAQYQFINSFFHATTGIRIDSHQTFGTNVTYKISPGFTFTKTQTTLNFNYATGYKAPTLFQLYDTFSGNINLNPDKSKSYDVTLEQKIKSNILLGATYFKNQFDETIEYDFVTNRYKNIGESSTDGFEFYVQATPIQKLNVLAQWTLLNSNDKSTGLELLRRPNHRGELDLQYSVSKKLSIGSTYTHVGKRFDVGNISMPTYDLFGLRTSYQISNRLSFMAKVENLFNKNYQEVLGFGMPGINWFSSVKYTL